jgi:hypothetical protein
MATHVECKVDRIPFWTPDEILPVGSIVKNIPKDVEGFGLRTRAQKITGGTAVRLCVGVKGMNFSLDARVTEYSAEQIMIEGKDRKIGSAAVWLNLHEHEEGGTQIGYGMHVDYSLFARFAEPIVDNHLHYSAPIFAHRYQENVVQHLDAMNQVPRQKAA